MRRMRYLWKVFVPVLIAAFISVVLTGCGEKEEAKPDPEGGEKTEHPAGEHPKAEDTKE